MKCYDVFNPKGISGNTHSTKSFIAGFVAYVFYKNVLNLTRFSRVLKDDEPQEQLWYFLEDVNSKLSNKFYFKKQEMKNTVYSWSNSLKRKRKEGNLQRNVIDILDLANFEWAKKKKQTSIKDTCGALTKDNDNDLESEELFSHNSEDEKEVEKDLKEQTKKLNPSKRNNDETLSVSKKKKHSI